MTRIVSAGLLVAALAAAYLFGAWSFAQDLWPIHALRNMKRSTVGQTAFVTRFDSFGRLTDWAGKQSVACPAQDARTAVILFVGQSIQGNHAGERSTSAHGDRVVSWFDGACTIAQSPLLGTTGMMGEPMTAFGNGLIAGGLFDRIILVPSAVGGTAIARWSAGGDLNGMLAGVLDKLAPQYRITQVVWHQGEDDFTAQTSEDAYRRGFDQLAAMIRAHGVAAPILVSVATRCDDDSKWKSDNPVARAQRRLPDAARGLFAGVDTDSLLTPLDRYDDCHLGGSGVAKYANALVEAVRQLPRPIER
jgi:hypothetical protein